MIIHPKNSGSEFYNYKGFFSIVLLALVDYDYRFIFVDVGCQGRISDGGVYRHCYFYEALEKDQLGLPEEVCYHNLLIPLSLTKYASLCLTCF